MTASAKLRYLRIAPRKVRLVVDLIRGKRVADAQTILRFTNKKGADPVLKTLNSAVASAKENKQLDETGLYISKITVDEGPKLKRWLPRARGVASPMQKKVSHITIELDALKGAKKIKVEKPETKKSPAGVAEEKKAPEIETPSEEKIVERPKIRQETSVQRPAPKQNKGLSRFFRRKAL